MIYLDDGKADVQYVQIDRKYYEDGIKATIESYFSRTSSWRKAKEISGKIASKVTDRFYEHTKFPDNNGVYYPHGFFLWKHDVRCNVWKPTCIPWNNAMIFADTAFWESLRNELNISRDLSGELHTCIRKLDEVSVRTYLWNEYEEEVDLSTESFVFSKLSFVLSDNFYEKTIDEVEPKIRDLLFGKYVVEKDFKIVESKVYAIAMDGERILVQADAFTKIYDFLKDVVDPEKARQFVVELKNIIFFGLPYSQFELIRIEDEIPWAKYYNEDARMQNNTWYIKSSEQLLSEIEEKMREITNPEDNWISFTNVELDNGMKFSVLIMDKYLWLGKPSTDKARHYPVYLKYMMLASHEKCYCEECADELWIALCYQERGNSFETYKRLTSTK